MTDYFHTPADPEGFSAALPSIQFRVIDFSALEYNTLQRAVAEYVRTYYRDQFNDFMASNGFMMLTDILCYIGAGLSQREDILINDAFLPTSMDKTAASNHLNLIGQNILRQTPATTQIMCSVGSPVATDIYIPAGYSVSVGGPDGKPVIYEIYSAPYDWTSKIVLPAKKRGVVAWAIEGTFASPLTQVAIGGADQTITINSDTILSEPIIVTVDNEEWVKVVALEKYGPNDKVYSIQFYDTTAVIKFGDDINGKSPIAGQNVRVKYREGGGIRGRIGTNAINLNISVAPEPPATASVTVNMSNVIPSNGGYDGETLNEAKKRAPREWATHNNIVSGFDYTHIASTFKHPVYGGVAKAVATLFSSINANIVRISILAEGQNGMPVKPALGLKEGLKTYLNSLNVLTDDVEIEDGSIKVVDIDMNVVLYRNADAASIKEKVDTAISDFFNIDNWDMGQPLYVASLYNIIMAINGVRYLDIFKPADDILAEKDVGSTPGADVVSYNQVIALGNKNVRIYYEKTE